MGAPLSDITLYTKSEYKPGHPDLQVDGCRHNFICDLYHRKLNGYKPPHTSRITLQPELYEEGKPISRFGSIVMITPYFNYAEYKVLTVKEQYHYLLELIHGAMLQGCGELGWDKSVFEKAYREILDTDFLFRIDYPAKLSRDKKNSAFMSVEKTETIASMYVNIQTANGNIRVKLFEHRNSYWYDCAYLLAKTAKWLDKDRFGIVYEKGKFEAWYSIEKAEVSWLENGLPVDSIDLRKHFYMQLP